MKKTQWNEILLTPNKDYISLQPFPDWIGQISCGLDQFESSLKNKNRWFELQDAEFFFSLGNNLSLLLFHHGKSEESLWLCQEILKTFNSTNCRSNVSAFALQSYINIQRLRRRRGENTAKELEGILLQLIAKESFVSVSSNSFEVSQFGSSESFKTFQRSLQNDYIKALLVESSHKRDGLVWDFVSNRPSSLIAEEEIIRLSLQNKSDQALQQALSLAQSSQGPILHGLMLRSALILKNEGLIEEYEGVLSNLLRLYGQELQIARSNFDFSMHLNELAMESQDLDLVYALTAKNFEFAKKDNNEVGMIQTLEFFVEKKFGDENYGFLLSEMKKTTGYRFLQKGLFIKSPYAKELLQLMTRFRALLPKMANYFNEFPEIQEDIESQEGVFLEL